MTSKNETDQTKRAGLDLVALQENIRAVYAADDRPWVIGYSGGKDSTCALQLIWSAIRALPEDARRKPIFVLSSDTLVETPVIVNYIDDTLAAINAAAADQNMPITAQKVVPEISDSFWVNLIGRGYPAPSKRFRWCTERLKIDPANAFIKNRVAEYGEVVMVLGVRSSESATRAQVMSLHKIDGTALSRHSTLPGAFVFTPIETFSVDDVWAFLLQNQSPWGSDNRDLLAMYRNAQAGECPLVVDKQTESCGNSRFGCWVCTVVTKDKAMEALVENGEEWLEPLLDLRDELAETQNPERKREFRDFRRRDGSVTFVGDAETSIPGPYLFEYRKELLRKLLEAQERVNANAPPGEKTDLIQVEELREIRRIWRSEQGDWGDAVSETLKAVTGKELPADATDGFEFQADDAKVLADVCAAHDLPSRLLAQLLEAERSVRGLKRRTLIHRKIASILEQEWRDEGTVLNERKARLKERKASSSDPLFETES
ncbi:DNA phosphorothioation system sulfurtransferase DndC [Roseobacter denitrificans]|uniref:Conserved domain protein n=1 Tax=Roseobacter denitrificans (strain ATCC 33942 / OCh 114) TaxID=375451 RepID=Q16C16_ROSDO|nr:DNA phosphorothioation system sulfurtransferase DndC [Roseobacter denitrificans]ABG30477.1 conserved domain protein [Roseobacter denitrificans OCh 114]AVL53632.1 DNA phosphorothioation system sulfurtransferase DndC [Roseobacter denitrificans]SFF73254.1 DNA sulfur modification protein DndC [Roseobacter denitrificans OCh 114]